MMRINSLIKMIYTNFTQNLSPVEIAVISKEHIKYMDQTKNPK